MADRSTLDEGCRRSRLGPLPWPPGVAPPEAGTLPELVDRWAQTSGSNLAVVSDDEQVTYAELARRSQQAAAALQRLGVGPGDAVGLVAPNCVNWLVIAVAAIRRGATLHAFNTWLRPAELDYLLRAADPKVLLTVDKFAATDFVQMVTELLPEVRTATADRLRSTRYPGVTAAVVLGERPELPGFKGWYEEVAAAASGAAADLSTPSSESVVVYTSGSTRAPKAVPLVQRLMIENGFAIGERMRLTEADRIWLASPLFWSYGIANAVMATFTHGATLVLEPRFEPHKTVQTLRRERCTAAYLLPTMVHALCQEVAEQVRELSDLRTGLTIGRSDDVRRVVDELGIEGICNVYGLTEVYGNCCVTDTSDPLDIRLTCQGRPLPEVELRVVDALGTPAPVGAPGLVEVRGRVMRGYLPTPDEEVPSPFTQDGWFRTGDTGLVREDGRFQFVGRHSEMIKTAGINVSPAEIEATLRTYPDVLEAAVVGVPDHARGEVPVAFVVTAGPIDEAALINHCSRVLSSYKVPRRIRRIDALPQTSTGKLSRKSLLSLAARERRP